jgi:hypothetical protein
MHCLSRELHGIFFTTRGYSTLDFCLYCRNRPYSTRTIGTTRSYGELLFTPACALHHANGPERIGSVGTREGEDACISKSLSFDVRHSLPAMTIATQATAGCIGNSKDPRAKKKREQHVVVHEQTSNAVVGSLAVNSISHGQYVPLCR